LKETEKLLKLLFALGLVVLVLGIASFFIPIPRTEREGVKAGNVDIGVDVRHHEHVSPIVSTVLVVAGAGMMIAGSRAKRA
jgi:uncharacterized protein YjeT (DUF2065 family)